MGVAEYKTLPKEIKRQFPEMEALQLKLQKEMRLRKKPAALKKIATKKLIVKKVIKNKK